MRYGFCTDIATRTRDTVEYELVRRIAESGFDYVEFPLMMIETLSDEEFETLLYELERTGIACDVCCNYFPGRIRVTGPEADQSQTDAYLEKAMGRAARMGVRKIVFGSCPSRNLPEGMDAEAGYAQHNRLLLDSVVPACQKRGIMVVIEPIRKQSANFIMTLEEGRRVVDTANAPEIQLLADIMHMHYNEESPEELRRHFNLIRHVHVCEMDRLLPEESYSEFTGTCLDILAECGYDRTISFESKDCVSPSGLEKALTLLRSRFS